MRHYTLPPRQHGDPWGIEEWAGLLLIPLSLLSLFLYLRFGPVWLQEPVCRFRLWSGIPCPACGGVRAWEALLSGRWSAAWRLQPGAMVLGLLALGFTGYSLWVVAGGRPRSRWRCQPRERVGLLLLTLLALLANWLYLLRAGL